MKRILLAAALLAAPVLAQVSALKGLDSSAPVDVDAARIEVQDAANQAVFSGDVVIRQGQLTLYADNVKILYTRKTGDPEMQRLDARGNVRLISPSERATANNGIYDVAGRIITMTGNVTLDRGGSMLKGQRLVLNLDTGLSSFDSRGPGTTGTPGRVTGRFVVPQRK
ncbi:lipopolysaccharide transport periplasmic protein LptA [Polymorphobacter fuscus]|uniref:Lipopolysaccharide transport periplasmic protein LptA n=1 Tax=Sandarakinorhabdus fusca TaxID=1439888 RepID=A0A7C9KZD3_9SPHN|nr:lipopolysaccharide transport periplasmic protein LptA [Polymorphobacter fuscus]KAB7645445.1 lipopolysaccharide transport periplasmic protein LptA [Polymorphobacter fuscus]MQT17868.1 lipopolysaccharide transport periplasmic protein LptA [Polymorphobacter fuscus]NJC08497.1 lipopolysaccharide export system protein LptA [Polymorphobacter fuscus]